MSSNISFDCACGERLAAAAEHAGMQVQCPRCSRLLAIPKPEAEFEYADESASDPPRAKIRVKSSVPAPSSKPSAPPSSPAKRKPVLVDEDDPPPKKKAVLVDDDDPPAKPKKKAKLVEDDRPKKKKKKASRGGGEPLSRHAQMYMEKANAELDEEEDRHRREGGGIHFTPGIIGGSLCFVIGSLLFVVFLCFFAHPIVLIPCGVLALGGIVRAVLSYMGQGVD